MPIVKLDPPKPPQPRPPWGWLSEALKLAPSEQALVDAGLLGDVIARIVHPARPAFPMPPEYWIGTLDPDRSRVRPAARLDMDKQKAHATWIGWHTIHVDLDSVRRCFGLDQQPVESGRRGGGGPKAKWNWELAVIGVLTLIIRRNDPTPERLTDVVGLLEQWFIDTQREAPSRSQLFEHAALIFDELHEQSDN